MKFSRGYNVNMSPEQANMIKHMTTTLNKRYRGGDNYFKACAFIKENYEEYVKRVREIKASNRRFYSIVSELRAKRKKRRFFDEDRFDYEDSSFYF